MIVNGDRNPGPELIPKLIQELGLKNRERTFFEDLIRLRKSERDPALTVEIIERLKKQHPQGPFKLLDDRSFSAISNWYYYAIRELVLLHDFTEDESWIAARLKYHVTPGQVKEAIQTLIGLGLLTRNKSGKLLQSVSRVTLSPISRVRD